VLPILITCGVVAMLGLSAHVLLRSGHVRAIGPVAAAILAVALLASASVVLTGAPQRLPVVAPAPAAPPAAPADPAPPAPPVAPEKVTCPGYAQPLGPAAGPIPTAPGKWHPPFQISGLPGAPGPVISSPKVHQGTMSMAPETIGNALLDHDDFYYVNGADSGGLFFHVEVGTPRVGDCALQLVYTVLRGVDGQRTQRITTLKPGPALARQHAVLACGMSMSNSGLNVCAWASTSNKPRPLFGATLFFPKALPSGFTEHPLSEAEIVSFADMAFSAVDG
jgi:hypothetical protein